MLGDHLIPTERDRGLARGAPEPLAQLGVGGQLIQAGGDRGRVAGYEKAALSIDDQLANPADGAWRAPARHSPPPRM